MMFLNEILVSGDGARRPLHQRRSSLRGNPAA
jgi:hypothetical protein